MSGQSFRRSPTPAWMRPIAERLPPTIRNLVVAQAVVFGLYVMASGLRRPMAEHLALGPLVAAGELWQPATSLFVHLDPLSFLFNLIGIWFVGATIERSLGRMRFLLLFFGAGLAANIVIAVLLGASRHSAIFSGCGDSILALFVALGMLYGRTQVRVIGQLVLEARILSGILVAMAILSALVQLAWLALAGSLVSVGVAYVVCGGRGAGLARYLLQRRSRRSFEILEGGQSKSSKRFVN